MLGSLVPEIIDPVFVKASPIRSFSMTENERFELVFTKTGSLNSGTGSLVTQRYGSEDPHPQPDPYQNVTDPQHFWKNE